MKPEQARAVLNQALLDIVPDALPEALPDDADLRQELELDSLDFVELVERLSARLGARIEEDDYPQLSTMGSAVAFLAGRSEPAARRRSS